MVVTIQKIKNRSHEIYDFWKMSKKWVPERCYDKVVLPKLDWYIQLTECLEMWNDKTDEVNEEELCLAYAILGELLEGWLQLSYCVYYAHCRASGKEQELTHPTEVSFEELESFARGKYWQTDDEFDAFVSKMKRKRECIAKEDKQQIGSLQEFSDDLILYGSFIEEIDIKLPYPDNM